MECPNGDLYEGYWSNNYFNGQGTYIWNDGRKYKGKFVDDLPEGYGIMEYPDGDVYEG